MLVIYYLALAIAIISAKNITNSEKNHESSRTLRVPHQKIFPQWVSTYNTVQKEDGVT